MLMQVFPDFMVTPAGKPLVDAIPFTIRRGQKTPLRPTPGDPEHTFYKNPAGGFFPGINPGMVFQEKIDLLPLVVTKASIRHSPYYALNVNTT